MRIRKLVFLLLPPAYCGGGGAPARCGVPRLDPPASDGYLRLLSTTIKYEVIFWKTLIFI